MVAQNDVPLAKHTAEITAPERTVALQIIIIIIKILRIMINVRESVETRYNGSQVKLLIIQERLRHSGQPMVGDEQLMLQSSYIVYKACGLVERYSGIDSRR